MQRSFDLLKSLREANRFSASRERPGMLEEDDYDHDGDGMGSFIGAAIAVEAVILGLLTLGGWLIWTVVS